MHNFLIYFWVFSILAIFIGRWLMNRVEGSNRFPMPSPTQLNTYEIAALREERKGVIHTALFNLWNEKLIEVSGKNQDAKINITSSNNLAPKNTFEAILYRFIAEQPRTPKDFFYQAPFHPQIDAELETTYQTLEKLHLRRTTEQLENMKKIPKGLVWLILGMVGAAFVLPLFYGLPISNGSQFLIYSLIPLYMIGGGIFSTLDYRMSVLGKRYLKELNTHFEWVKTEERKDFDPALRVAIFGIAGLAGFAMFVGFEEVFADSESADGD